jgi:TldD protein
VKEILYLAVETLKQSGVTFGDARYGSYKWQNINARNNVATNISNDSSEGIGVRAFKNGGWGFASSSDLNADSIVRLAKEAVEIAEASAKAVDLHTKFSDEEIHSVEWKTSFKIDPFLISISEKIDFLMAINQAVLKASSIKQVNSFMNFACEHKYYLDTYGTYSDQLLMRVLAGYSATAVGKNGFESRSYIMTPLNAGYETVLNEPFIENAERIASEATGKLHAHDCPHQVTNLIILPSHTALTIHETIGHATELDRVMGWEADMAGTSFATIEKLNRFKYAAPIVNVVADRTTENGRASVPIDDDGVKTGRWHIIKNGMLTGYSTTRSTAHFINEERSRGCSYADSWSSLPILRMPNVSIEPGKEGSPTLDELIADTPDGILVDGTGSFSIDHQRINFQFGCDCAWRIKEGKRTEILRRFTYQSYNPVFWNSVDAICNEDEWRQHGVVSCGKGQPMQLAQLTHGSAPLRLRNITVGKARI